MNQMLKPLLSKHLSNKNFTEMQNGAEHQKYGIRSGKARMDLTVDG